MSKIITLGVLQMKFAAEGNDVKKFNTYLKKFYTPSEQKRITAAFKLIGKANEVNGGTSMLDKDNK